MKFLKAIWKKDKVLVLLIIFLVIVLIFWNQFFSLRDKFFLVVSLGFKKIASLRFIWKIILGVTFYLIIVLGLCKAFFYHSSPPSTQIKK